MVTQTKVQKYFGKRTLSPTKQVQTKISWSKKSFEVCGISSTDTGKVRNGDFFKQCMEKALQNLEADEGNDIDEDPFELYDQ